MIAVLFIGFIGLCFVGCSLWGAVSRIADAIEKQNRHYGIGQETPAAKPEESA